MHVQLYVVGYQGSVEHVGTPNIRIKRRKSSSSSKAVLFVAREEKYIP